MQPLPIDALLPEILDSLRDTPNLVVEAPTGAGKTTRVAPAVLDAGLAGSQEVWVLEPRRMAARMAARRVAEERGEELGETVGYQVRFEEASGPRTRIRFLTEGVLTRRLLSDPQLSRVGAVVLDEFHERHLQADLALALLRRLQKSTRPDLRLVAMSATLDAAPVALYLGECPVLRSEGRSFEVAVEHLARPDERPLASQVEAAIRRLASEGLDGDVLVFLPGASEIRRAQEACARIASDAELLVLPLHGELPAAEQERAVRPAGRRKIILSTNVAETSLTIEGVVAVVDSGLARVASHSHWSGLQTLGVARISRASATQRAGRAGRTREGRCLRLYTAQDFNARPAYETPEISRLDLAEPALELHAAGVTDLDAFEWFEPPPPNALAAAGALLQRLDAIDAGGRVNARGRRMLRLPLHPRLSRLVVEAEARNVADEGCLVAALINERDIRASSILPGTNERRRTHDAASSPSDLLELRDLFTEAERANFAPESLRRLNLEARTVRTVERVRRQLQRLCAGERKERGERGRGREERGKKREDAGKGREERGKALSKEQETELLIAILTGYPDRVARRRVSTGDAQASDAELLLAGGSGAELAPESVVRQADLLVAVDAEERVGAGRGRAGGRSGARTFVRLASAIEPEWLLDLYTNLISETTEASWNSEAERVEVVRRLVYEGLTLDESRTTDARDERVAQVLAGAALAAGVEAFAGEEINHFRARVEFMSRTFPEAGFPVLSETDVRAGLVRLCEGRRSFAELRAAARAGGLLEELRARLSAEQKRMLAASAPERIALATGRQVRVNYERERTPWAESRLQDFFGMKEGPKIAGGRVALVLHLLAPNRRPVQLTADLAGFWTRHYPQVRRELSRRYPRHAWPENPLAKPEKGS
ncbi:MAG TPA: ATP-dependent helicase C-terminal domain-containing protein [Pyrinomonadaceae bacterium]|nr:ATP-dependent helicase C-terminal domain-containing protein [Pyrinomonadaceae bacterium]